MTLWAEDSSRSQEEIDRDIETALRKVGIWEALFARNHKGKSATEEVASSSGSDSVSDTAIKDVELITLDSDLEPESTLSIGQQQLFCLARGLFLHNDARIVLMDEFTSSMDNETEMLVRQIVKEDMKDKTVVEVIHRLQHILDFDMALVVDKGQVIEEGHPVELLQKDGGHLRELYLTNKG
jgi:ABC-type multidrug transport system fused ATPase/permease subunit